jgi:imidazole glycerol-phosphate synthase subunit HisH
MIAIIDYDIGNVNAIENMLGRLGFNSKITADPKDIELADKIILPGNGAYDACLINLKSTGLVPLLERKVFEEKTPLLGICVGAQMLGKASEEGVETGLGWIDMTVKRFPVELNLPVPNMGWRDVKVNRESHYLIKNLDKEARFYFVHSYFMNPKNNENILMTSNYGFDFVAGVISENILGVQFHPEKSHRFGKALLAAFAVGEN